MKVRYAVRVFAIKDDKIMCIRYKDINKDFFDIPGGKIEDGETPLDAAKRECHEELGNNAIFDETLFELVMEFDEIATSDGKTPIHFYIFKYNGLRYKKIDLKNSSLKKSDVNGKNLQWIFNLF